MSSMRNQLGALNQIEALQLLESNLSLEIASFPASHVAIQFADECKHSRTAIEILGRALRGKVLDEWTKAYQTLKRGERENVGIVYKSVKLSYDHLNDEETKICFLLCSLFPKDHSIALQDLVTYAWGLRIYKGVDSIEEVRKKVCGEINILKESFLLLEHGEAHVRMENEVREAALWIASKGESFHRIKSVAGLWERQKNENLESYTAISYVASKQEVLNNEEFRGEKLQILYLGGDGPKKISNEFLQMLEALRVLTIFHGRLSAEGLQNLTKLRALHLEKCKLEGLSKLGKLKKLEILRFRGSDISELPDETGELDNLRLLDLFDCQNLRIHLNLIRRLSRLEELYFSGLSFEEWWSEEKRAEGSNTIQSKIFLPSSFETESSIDQKTNDDWFDATSRVLKVSVSLPDQPIDVKYLGRDHILCYKDRVVRNLQRVEKVRVRCCDKLQAVFQDGSILHDKEENSEALHSDLTYLELEELSQLRWIWRGETDKVNLQNLSTVKLKNCPNLKSLFPLSLAGSMDKLETLEIHGCKKLKQIIIADRSDDRDVDRVDEEINPAILHPQCLPKLTTLRVTDCGDLEYIFHVTGSQILPKITLLEISSCSQLAHVFSFKDATGRKEIEVPQLKQLELKELTSLKTFCSETGSIKLPELRQFEVRACPQLSHNVMSEVIKHRKLEDFCLFQVGTGEIFELEGGYVLSNLKKLILGEIKKLEFIWKRPTQIVTLQNLTHFEVVKCHELRTIFSPSLARNLLHLSNLVVKGCEKLEQIVAREQNSSSSTARLKPEYFPNLMKILIEDCSQLKSLFPVSDLPKLTTFTVKGASKLTEIFRDEGEANAKSSKKEIVLRFPKLEVLHLENLPELISFMPVQYSCEFPVLNSLVGKQCHRLATSFLTPDSEHTVTIFNKEKKEPTVAVYAETKATEETSPPEKENHSKFRRAVTLLNIPVNRDIDWSPGMKLDRNKQSEGGSHPTEEKKKKGRKIGRKQQRSATWRWSSK